MAAHANAKLISLDVCDVQDQRTPNADNASAEAQVNIRPACIPFARCKRIQLAFKNPAHGEGLIGIKLQANRIIEPNVWNLPSAVKSAFSRPAVITLIGINERAEHGNTENNRINDEPLLRGRQSVWSVELESNDPSSATAATMRVDCNSDAMPPFAAAHG
jgi:hypothetical protein